MKARKIIVLISVPVLVVVSLFTVFPVVHMVLSRDKDNEPLHHQIEMPEPMVLNWDSVTDEQKVAELYRVTGLRLNPAMSEHKKLIDRFDDIDIIEAYGFGTDSFQEADDEQIRLDADTKRPLKMRMTTKISEDYRMRYTILVLFDTTNPDGQCQIISQFEWITMPLLRTNDSIKLYFNGMLNFPHPDEFFSHDSILFYYMQEKNVGEKSPVWGRFDTDNSISKETNSKQVNVKLPSNKDGKVENYTIQFWKVTKV